MKKKFSAFLIACPALLLFLNFKAVPAVSSFIISMKDYTVFRGVSGSPWVGGRNFSEYFQSLAFIANIKNTLILNTLSIVLTCALASLLAICISKMPGKWWKLASIIVISIPAFIPIVSYFSVFMTAIPYKSFFTNPSYYPFLFAIMDSLRNLYVPVIIGVLACDAGENTDLRRIAPVMLGYIMVRATMLLSPDIETILVSYNPMVYQSSDVFDSYQYRNGLLQSNISLSNTAWVVKTAAQILINTVLYFLGAGCLRNKREIPDKLRGGTHGGKGSIISIAGCVLLAAGSMAVIRFIIPAPAGFIDGAKMLLNHNWFIPSILNSLKYGVISCMAYGFITITLAYPLAFRTRVYPFVLIIMMSVTNNYMSEYLGVRNLGMINTLLPIVIHSSLSVIGAFALHFTLADKLQDRTPGFGEYVSMSIPPLITIASLFFISNWGGYLNQLVYLNNRSSYGISLFGRELTLANGNTDSDFQTAFESVRSAYVFISSILPVMLGTLLICLNKYLPLKAFSAQSRKG